MDKLRFDGFQEVLGNKLSRRAALAGLAGGAEDAPGLFYGFGWAQTHNHGDLLLQLYAQARGRAAEAYGEEFLLWDQIIRTFGLHERGAIWYAEQTADFRANLDAFAAGINAYAERHADRLAAA